jgi:hypothetical protein
MHMHMHIVILPPPTSATTHPPPNPTTNLFGRPRGTRVDTSTDCEPGARRSMARDFSEQRASNRASTFDSISRSTLSTAELAAADLEPLLSSISLPPKKREAVINSLAGQHRTWTNAAKGLLDWFLNDHAGWDRRMDECKLSVGERGQLKAALERACAPPPTKCTATVRCGDVTLKLTLTAKFMSRSFADALIAPFLKAYSKKAGLDVPASVAEVASVTIDGANVADIHAAVQELVRREEASVLVVLSAQSAPAADATVQQGAAPEGAAPAAAAAEDAAEAGSKAESYVELTSC